MADRIAADVTAVVTGIKPPERARRGGGVPSPYPFDSLEVGGSFGVKNKDKKAMTSTVSNANRKFREPVKDAAGNIQFETKELKNADGTVTHVPDTDKPKTESTKHFYVVDVDADLKKQIKGTPAEGSLSMVFRDK